jgi:molybdate transport system substrate-binding protein
MGTTTRRVLGGLCCLGVVLAAGCGDDDAASSTSSTAGDCPGWPQCDTVDGTVTVFAAASLTDAFGEVAEAFMVDNPDVTVELNLAGSSTLREQILAGAPSDVFASANLSNMDQVVGGGAADESDVFATNSLEIVVPAGNPGDVDGLDDFANPDLLIGLCAPEVPCGEFGREALANAGVTPAQDTDEPDVRSLLTKVSEGELDAGLVYRSDVLAAGDVVEGIELAEDDNVVAEYPIAVLAESGNAEAAEAFVAFLLGDDGQAILEAWGFGPA